MHNQSKMAGAPNSGDLPKKRWTTGLGVMLLSGVLMGGVLMSGCSGGGGSDSTTQAATEEETGQVALALTDAEGDFLTYAVDVNSIELTRRDGAVVEALPISTTVDFAEYVEVSELLTMATVPAGVYTSIELNLDYTNANVTVQAENGDPIQADLVDSDGEPLAQLAVSLELTSGSEFTIAPGIPAQVTLDLDLDASNEVTIDGDEATVTVEPILFADTQFENPKSLRLRGLLDEVVEAEEVFVLNIRPFRHRQGNFGSARVHVDDETHYEIDGVVFDGEAGLAQLATLAELTPIISLGEWDRETSQYTADTVLAGSSVPWGEVDALRGVVIARSENTLTVRGAVIELANGNFRFNDDITLLVSEQTSVTKQLEGMSEASINDISVGSAIRASGELTDDRTLDASEGHVRIRLNNVTGNVVSVSPLSVDLQRISGRHTALFDFTGTGTDSESDADPENYEVDTSTLTLNSLNIGDPIKVRGTVTTFGTAPEDFVAQTVFDASELKGHLFINYGPGGSEMAIAQATNDMLVFDLTDSSTRHHVKRANILTDLSDFESMPVVIPAEQTGIFALTRRGSIEIHRNFADFVTALNDALAAGELVTRIDAHGHFDDTNVQMSSKRLRVGLTQ
jgi:Domain of unknown function (DUF4382)